MKNLCEYPELVTHNTQVTRSHFVFLKREREEKSQKEKEQEKKKGEKKEMRWEMRCGQHLSNDQPFIPKKQLNNIVQQFRIGT